MFDIYTIIFLALAVFIFLRLRSVLGQRTGRERPPYDPYSARDTVRSSSNDNVVALPGRTADSAQKPAEPAEPSTRPSAGAALPNLAPPLAIGLEAIAREDKSFDPQHFVAGARAAYEMIVTAYAEGDRRSLKNLLSRDVYEGFEAAIRERETRGRDRRDALCLDRQGRYHRRGAARAHGAGHRAFCVATGVGHPRQERQCDRWQSGQSDRGHRRVDIRARRLLARSELEARRDRSRDNNRISGDDDMSSPSVGDRSSSLWLGCAGSALGQEEQLPDIDPLQIPDTQLEPIRWSEIDGWAGDDHAAAFTTFQESCKPFLSRKRPSRDTPADGRRARASLQARSRVPATLTAAKARAFFEENFRPVRIAKLGETPGLLTGYYEPIVDGSRFPNPEFPRPALSAAARSGDRRADAAAGASLPNRGKVGRRNAKNEFEPYHDRAAIEDGALDGQQARDRLAEGPVRGAVHPDPGLGARAAGRRHHAARQLRRP